MVGGGVKFAGDQAVLHDEQAGTQADTFVCCIAQYDYSLALTVDRSIRGQIVK